MLSVSMTPIGEVDLYSGAALHLALDGYDSEGGPLTYVVSSSNPDVTASVPEGNRSMKISVASEDGAIDGEMLLELFEGRASRVTSQIITLAESGFYDGVTFHRVIDDFMIQGGDPTGTGSGGSALGDFDDQFHPDLMHTSSGVLSMAKSSDDTNDSQFFITDIDTRHLDFEHSVFGFLVEGYDVLDAISSTEVDGGNRPDSPVVMESVEIVYDNENAVLMLDAPEGYTGESEITITVIDQYGNQYPQESFVVNVTPDPFDNELYLLDIPEIRTTVDTNTTVQLEVFDPEGIVPFGETPAEGEYDKLVWLFDDYKLWGFEGFSGSGYEQLSQFLYTPLLCHENLTYYLDDFTGQVEVIPSGGLTGTHPITLGAGHLYGYQTTNPNDPANPIPYYRSSPDVQVVPVHIVPDVAPESAIAMTLVRDETEVSGTFGEVDALPENEAWIDEWSEFSIEVWAKIDDAGSFGIKEVATDLNYDSDLFTVSEIEYGPGFAINHTGEVNAEAGVIENLGGTTKGFLVSSYTGEEGDLYPSNDPEDLYMWGDDQYTLVARVHLEPNVEGGGLALEADGGYATPTTELGFALENSEIKWNETDGTDVTELELQGADLWPVIYDINDSQSVDIVDILTMIGCYQHEVGEEGYPETWASDLNRNGTVDINDILLWIGNYQLTPTSENEPFYPDGFPEIWTPEATSMAATSLAFNQETSSDSENEEETAAVDWVFGYDDPLF